LLNFTLTLGRCFASITATGSVCSTPSSTRLSVLRATARHDDVSSLEIAAVRSCSISPNSAFSFE
jgi:hypothetical protein